MTNFVTPSSTEFTSDATPVEGSPLITNGAGTTTTFNMIAGSEIPTSGKIFLYSNDITGVPTHKLYDLGLLRTFQLSQEYKKMTVLENLMVAGSHQVGENIFNSWFSSKKVNLREKEILEN